MSRRIFKGRERDTANDSMLRDYEDRYYEDLKRRGSSEVRILNSTYRCPYCPLRKGDYYLFDELLKHSYRHSRVSSQRSEHLKDKAKHIALERYLNRYIKDKGKRPKHYSANAPEHPIVHDHGAKAKDPIVRVNECRSKIGFHIVRNEDGDEQLFVWPWVGIIANIPTKLANGHRVGESGSNLRHDLAGKGFNPVKVHSLWNFLGHSGFAIVEFRKDWGGLNNGLMFEKDFQVNHYGKMDFESLKPEERGDKLFGWLARGDDYYRRGIVGDYLRKEGDLISVSGKETEDRRKDSTLVIKLTDTLQMKNQRIEEMKTKVSETTAAFNEHMQEKEAMIDSYNDELGKMEQIARDHFEKISMEHEQASLQLEAKRKELDECEKKLRMRESQNDNETRKLHYEKKMNERAILEQKKADDNMLKLAEEQKRQKVKLRKKILDLEKKLDARQALELEIERLKGALEVIKHMKDDEDVDIKKKMDEMEKELEEKNEELEYLESLNQTLMVSERRNNDQLQDARKELISGLREDNRSLIRVKKMGELDIKPFFAAAKSKFPDDETEVKAIELCSLWDSHLRDPSWHAFKVIIDENGNPKEIINEEDEKLKQLKDELGDEVHEAVVKALKEINEYNPSGRYIVREIWNSKEKRRASLQEGVAYLVKQWSNVKRVCKNRDG